jgi:hypothetical protein
MLIWALDHHPERALPTDKAGKSDPKSPSFSFVSFCSKTLRFLLPDGKDCGVEEFNLISIIL